MITFEQALENWTRVELASREARLTHEIAWGQVVAASAAKNAEGRKAEADNATQETKRAADKAEVEALSAYHLMVYLRNSAGNHTIA